MWNSYSFDFTMRPKVKPKEAAEEAGSGRCPKLTHISSNFGAGSRKEKEEAETEAGQVSAI